MEGKLSPYWLAHHTYRKGGQAYTWNEVCRCHCSEGLFVSTDKYFLMARPVLKDASQKELVDPYFKFDSKVCDAWFVYMAAGEVSTALWNNDLFDYEWAMWYRWEGQLSCYRTEDLKRVIKYAVSP